MKYTCLNCWVVQIYTADSGEGYILHIHTEDAVDGYTLDTPCRVQMIERYTPCMSTVLAVEKGYTIISTLLTVEIYTPCRWW
jgi:hypothetical protein